MNKILQSFKNYQNATPQKRQAYLKKFEVKMIYRTTKTENPTTTAKMVREILCKS